MAHLLLHQQKRLRDLKSKHAYAVAKLKQVDINPIDDAELLQLLEITDLQANLSFSLNEFLGKDFTSQSTLIKMGLGILCNMASQLTLKGAEALNFDVNVLADPFIENYENEILKSLKEFPYDRP